MTVVWLGVVLALAGCGSVSEKEAVLLTGEPAIMETEPTAAPTPAPTAVADVPKQDPIDEQLKLLMKNLGTEEFVAEAIAQICHPEWTQDMIPEGMAVKRYVRESAYGSLYLQVSNLQEDAETILWYVEEDRVRVVVCNREMLQVMTCGFKEEAYDGAFECWRLLSSSGSIYHETGSFQNGNYTGECSIEAKAGQKQSDLFSLWMGKELRELEKYDQLTDQNGERLLCQPVFPGKDRFLDTEETFVTMESEYLIPNKNAETVEMPAEELPKQPELPQPTQAPEQTGPSIGQETEIEWHPDMM